MIRTLAAATAAVAILSCLGACQPDSPVSLDSHRHVSSAWPDCWTADPAGALWAVAPAGSPDAHGSGDYTALHDLGGDVYAMIRVRPRGADTLELLHLDVARRAITLQRTIDLQRDGHFLGLDDQRDHLRDGDALVLKIDGDPTRVNLRTGEVEWRLTGRFRAGGPTSAGGYLVEAPGCPGVERLLGVDVASGDTVVYLRASDAHSGLNLSGADVVRTSSGEELLLADYRYYDSRAARSVVVAAAYRLPLARALAPGDASAYEDVTRRDGRWYAPRLTGVTRDGSAVRIAADSLWVSAVDSGGLRPLGGFPGSRISNVWPLPGAEGGTGVLVSGYGGLSVVDVADGSRAWATGDVLFRVWPVRGGYVAMADSEGGTRLLEAATGRVVFRSGPRACGFEPVTAPIYDAGRDLLVAFDGEAFYAQEAGMSGGDGGSNGS